MTMVTSVQDGLQRPWPSLHSCPCVSPPTLFQGGRYTLRHTEAVVCYFHDQVVKASSFHFGHLLWGRPAAVS